MNLFNLLSPKTDFYIIECFHSGIRALSLRLKDNEVTFQKYFDGHGGDSIAELFKLLKLKKNSRVLFLYDHSIAATFAGFVKLEKNNLQTPIAEEDLQTFLAAATRQFFNRFREEAKRRLAVDEVNVVLANNRFFNLNLDGKQVISPLGQTARFAELEMEQTYLSRHFWDEVHESTQDLKNVFHIELAGALDDTLRLLYPDQKLLLAVVFPGMTKIFSYGGKTRYFGAVSFPRMQDRGELASGSDSLLGLVQACFPVSKEVAEKMLSLYVGGGMSKHFGHVFRGVIEPYTTRFNLELAKFFKREEMCVVLTKLPFLNTDLKTQPKKVTTLSFDNLAMRLGLEVGAPRFFPPEAFSPVFLSGLIAYLHRTSDNYLSGLAKERLRWLTPENSA